MFSNEVIVQENLFYITKNNTLSFITIWKPPIINISPAITFFAPAIAKIVIANIDFISVLRR